MNPSDPYFIFSALSLEALMLLRVPDDISAVHYKRRRQALKNEVMTPVAMNEMPPPPTPRLYPLFDEVIGPGWNGQPCQPHDPVSAPNDRHTPIPVTAQPPRSQRPYQDFECLSLEALMRLRVPQEISFSHYKRRRLALMDEMPPPPRVVVPTDADIRALPWFEPALAASIAFNRSRADYAEAFVPLSFLPAPQKGLPLNTSQSLSTGSTRLSLSEDDPAAGLLRLAAFYATSTNEVSNLTALSDIVPDEVLPTFTPGEYC